MDLRDRVDGSGVWGRGDDWSQGRRPEIPVEVRPESVPPSFYTTEPSGPTRPETKE